jgi:dipeptidyl aminopeptidase/acylaminoacyl peptidase
LLAYTRDAADKTANGLYIMNLKSGLRIPLDQDGATYSQMTWDEEGTALAVLKGNKSEKFIERENQLIAFTDLGGGSPSRHELNSTENKHFPKDMVISEKGELSWNSDATNKPVQLIFEDKSFGRLTKAKNTDQYMVTIESFSEYSDYYVTNATFANVRRITDANPQQVEYNWGHTVLIDYTNKDGVRLQGVIAIPDTRKPDERLPMLVSFYEKTSQYLNHYVKPRYVGDPGSHLIETISKGYMLLSPDVHFNTGATGGDMLECVEAAVDKAVELGYADPERIGLCGHSFRGYGAAYIATRSKKFAAVSAGAGVMELGSDFNHLWGYSVDNKKGGGANAHQYQIYSQGRMGTNPHDNFELYYDQSPITHVKEMITPLLLIQGEADTTVAWIETIGMYNAMRFNDKKIILLSYPGEGHVLSKRVNKIDLTRRVIQFFDHYLMDKPAPDWMTKGVPFLEKESSKTDAGK